MELWIRSENRMILIKPDFIFAEPVEAKKDTIWRIKGKHGINNMYSDYTLGWYKTEKRALEVLDEIQNILKPTIKIKYEYDDSQPIINGEWLKSLKKESKIEELSTYVYEMPKE